MILSHFVRKVPETTQDFAGWVVLASIFQTRQDPPPRRGTQARRFQLSPPRRLAVRRGSVPLLAAGFKFKGTRRFRVGRIGAPLSQRPAGPE